MSSNRALPRIASLSDPLINQIAAGEVIERPSSVVKELVENAIDSGATRIEIRVERGGTEKIVISDNGCGIHPEDLELAICRHTTSKLHDLEQLNAIASLGFRGEALSSIASVSDFSITSRIASQEYAMKLEFDPFTSQSILTPAAANTGTTVEVLKIFQSVPARRKFLRSAKTEYLHIQEVIKRLAMSRSDIAFSFYHNGKQVMSCPPDHKNYRDRIASVMGKGFYDNAWFIDDRIEDVHVWGWIGNEKTFRSQSDRQYLYLNSRIIRDKHISHAIRKAMDEIVHESRFPSYILCIDIDHSKVDVNVHPTKQEVRFRSPRTIHDFIHAAISNAVKQAGETMSLPGSDFVQDAITDKQHPPYSDLTYGINDLADSDLHETNGQTGVKPDANPVGEPIMLIAGNILLANYGNDIRMIDFYNLNKYLLLCSLEEEMKSSGVKSRPLLVPVVITLNERQIEKILSVEEVLLRLGIDFNRTGPRTVTMRTIPSLLPEMDIQQFIYSVFVSPGTRQGKNAEDIMEILETMVEVSLPVDSKGLKPAEIASTLKRCAKLDLPFTQRDYAGYWKTVTLQDFRQIIKDG